MIGLWLLWGCACRPSPPAAPPPTPVETVSEAVKPAGQVTEGRYDDATFGFGLPIPEGWTATVGEADDPLRLRLEQVTSGAQIELWCFEGQDLTPRPRDGCTWTFQDEAPFRALRTSDAIVGATCTPLDPTVRVAFAYLVALPDGVLQAEVHVPRRALLRAKAEGDQVLSGIRW
jgi:hypothetical protein